MGKIFQHIWLTTLKLLRVSKNCFPGGASGKEPTRQCRRREIHGFHTWVSEDPLEEGMATHSSILAWRISWTEEPNGLQSTGSQRVRHDWSNLACMQKLINIPQQGNGERVWTGNPHTKNDQWTHTQKCSILLLKRHTN